MPWYDMAQKVEALSRKLPDFEIHIRGSSAILFSHRGVLARTIYGTALKVHMLLRFLHL
jgi:hypothetical protein